MASGFFALLDDVAALAKLAAASIDDIGLAAGKATAKAAGVVVDDTAVTPQYVQGIAAHRELPIIKRQFGHLKVRYRGLAKNTAQLTLLFALSNLWMVRRKLLVLDGHVRLKVANAR